MPRHIDNFRKVEDLDVNGKEAPRARLEVATVLMIAVVLGFIWHTGGDALELSKVSQLNKLQQSKLRMAEYSKNSCDALKLTEKCTTLLGCIQLKDTGIWTYATDYATTFADELAQDYHLPAVAMAFLLLIQLIQSIKGTQHRTT